MKHFIYALGLLCLGVIFSSCENSQGLDDNALEIPAGVLYYTKSMQNKGYLEKVFLDGSNKSVVRDNALMTQYPVKGRIVYNVIDKLGGTYSLCSSNYDGSGEKVISTSPSVWAMQYISSDERYIIKYTLGNPKQIVSYDKKTGNNLVITDKAASESMNEISPDGKKFAYQESTEDYDTGILYLVNVDGTGKIKLAENSLHENDLGYIMAWSRDSELLAVVDNTKKKIMVFRADGSNFSTINSQTGELYFPAISPDNTLIAYSEDGNIVMNNIQGTNPKIIALGDEANEVVCGGAVFSPDGKSIAYIRGDNDGNLSILFYNIETAKTYLVTNIDFNGATGDKYLLPRIFWF